MSLHEIADDDIVRTHAEGDQNERPPLVVLEPLIDFLDAAGIGEGELEISPIGDGHSNVTYAVQRGEADFILRRPPRGPLPPSAHDVLREARVIGALDATAARVPQVLAVGDDEAIIGAPFFIMERVEGEVISTELPELFNSEAQRQRLGEELIDGLVELHAVDWEAAGLEGFGKPTGYLERQFEVRLAALLELDEERVPGLVDRVFGSIVAEEAIFEALRIARAKGIRTGLLSNSWGIERYPHDLLPELFDAVVISGQEGVRKPDLVIYEVAIERLGVPASEIVFVDDLPGNLKPARELGMTTVHHTSAANTLDQLEQHFALPLR